MSNFNNSPTDDPQCPAPGAHRPALYRIIEFTVKHGNCGGSLMQFQPGDEPDNALPFSIGKVLVSSDMKPDDVRGNHAHHETEEIVVVWIGGCTFELDDGRGTRERVRLGVKECGSMGVGGHASDEIPDNPNTPLPPDPDTKPALLLYPHIWRTFFDFEPGTVLLIVANMKYDEVDYIRDRDAFEEAAKTWDTLGGSATPL